MEIKSETQARDPSKRPNLGSKTWNQNLGSNMES